VIRQEFPHRPEFTATCDDCRLEVAQLEADDIEGATEDLQCMGWTVRKVAGTLQHYGPGCSS
jgi:hypothetical protein